MTYLDHLISRYGRRGIVVDTNLLLLYVTGLHNPGLVSAFKRTAIYTQHDFEMLQVFLGFFSSIITTPHILTEASDLAAPLNRREGHNLSGTFHGIVRLLNEHHVPAILCTGGALFARHGLADSAIAELSRGRYLVLTDDLPLYGQLLISGIDAINFDHLRAQY